jgi:hypothetical protein
MPLIYALIGVGAFFISYIDPQDPRASIALGIALLCEIAALTVFLRRQDYRALSREYSWSAIERPAPPQA